jgi:hypothetical protein
MELELGKERRRAGMGAVETGQGTHPFIAVGGRQGWPGRVGSSGNWCLSRLSLSGVKEGGGVTTAD